MSKILEVVQYDMQPKQVQFKLERQPKHPKPKQIEEKSRHVQDSGGST